MTPRLAAAALAIALLAVPAPALAVSEQGQGSPNLEHVLNVPYEARNGKVANYGTDIEFAQIGGREYALAGSYRNGLQIVDITEPREATIVGVYDCGVTQGDVQVFRQADKPGRTFVTYTSDTYGDGTSTCYREAEALGYTDLTYKTLTGATRGRNGTFIAEITDPRNPVTRAFAEIPQGSHNQTVHPSGEYMYNSNSDLMTSLLPAIEIVDIRNFDRLKLTQSDDPEEREQVVKELPLPTRPGLGTESHDITFDEDGDRAYSAALSQGVIINTEDPWNPEVVSSFVDPAINVWHQSDPVTIGDREFLIVEDEFVGAVPTNQCPNGGVHVYDITGAKERSPEKVGYWNISDLGPTTNAPDGTCTAHVFRVHEKERIMTIAWYNGGVRVVDISGLEGLSIGEDRVLGEGMRELAWYRFPDSDTWSAKTPRIQGNGDFWLFGNDIARGLDVYRYDAEREPSKRKGAWKGGRDAEARPGAQPRFVAPLDLIREGHAQAVHAEQHAAGDGHAEHAH